MSDGASGPVSASRAAPRNSVDGVAGLAAEPGDQGRAAALRPEQGGVEPERAVRARPAPASGPGPRSPRIAAGSPALGVAAQRGDERLVGRAVGGDPHEVVVGQVDQRRLQRGREGEVVGGQERGAAGRDEVHHRDVGGDVEPVLTGDGHPRLAQGPDHRLEGRPARSHQDQDVAGAVDPAPLVAVRRPAPDRLARPDGRPRPAGEAAPDASTGGVQASGSGSSPRISVGHSSTRPGASGRAVSWRGAHVVAEGQALEMRRVPEGLVHGREHGSGRAEGEGSAARPRSAPRRRASAPARSARLSSNSCGAAPWKE